MEIIDPGHVYVLKDLDGDGGENVLTFVKREGDKYPGNVGHFPGTTTQEVLRALIDRTKYVNGQIPDEANIKVLVHLRTSIYMLEKRAARRHKRELPISVLGGIHGSMGSGIEDEPVCDTCGHIGCTDVGHLMGDGSEEGRGL